MKMSVYDSYEVDTSKYLAIPKIVGHIPKGLYILLQRYMFIFTTDLFIITKYYEMWRYSSSDIYIIWNLWYTYTMEHYPSVSKDERIKSWLKWIKLETIIMIILKSFKYLQLTFI